MASKRKRGSSWEFKVTRKKLLPPPGYRTFTFDSEEEGETYCKRLENLLDQGIVPDGLQKQDATEINNTIREVVTEYERSVPIKENDESLLRLVVLEVGSSKMSEITYDWAEKWVNSMKRSLNLAPGTIRHRVGALARCFDWALKKGYLAINPLRTLPRGYASYSKEDAKHAEPKEDTERDRRLEEGEEEMILKVVLMNHKPENKQRPLNLANKEAHHLLFTLASNTAMRLREMFTLRRRQVNMRKRTIYLEKTKNGDTRQIPMASNVYAAIQEYFDAVPSSERGLGDLIFPWWDGVPSKASLNRTTSRLSRRWRSIIEHAGCENLVFHDFRHEATCRYYERTKLSDIQIARITGHKDMRMLRRYASLRGSDLVGELW